jgi:hypothetical protein
VIREGAKVVRVAIGEEDDTIPDDDQRLAAYP